MGISFSFKRSERLVHAFRKLAPHCEELNWFCPKLIVPFQAIEVTGISVHRPELFHLMLHDVHPRSRYLCNERSHHGLEVIGWVQLDLEVGSLGRLEEAVKRCIWRGKVSLLRVAFKRCMQLTHLGREVFILSAELLTDVLQQGLALLIL